MGGPRKEFSPASSIASTGLAERKSLATRLARVAAKAQREFQREDPFKRAIFIRLVEAAVAEARKRHLIAA
jgi:hypothetical protein